MSNWLQKQWLCYTPWHILLLPLSWVFAGLTCLRRALYRLGLFKSYRLPVPVIIVGNINVGGTGKTPLVIWIVEQLKKQGYTPGVVSRGYGGGYKNIAEVFVNSHPSEVGDEPVLIARRTASPMFVGANRVAAGRALLSAHPECNILVSDDGLQHYRLQRDFEIALINSDLQFGNQLLLPAGPLREKVTRLQGVDALVNSGSADVRNFNITEKLLPPIFSMRLQGDAFENISGIKQIKSVDYFRDKPLVAIAGIGNPERFFNQLIGLGLQFERKIFADHHVFTEQDLLQFANKTLLMTEKDAVKCQMLNTVDAWYLPVTAALDKPSGQSLTAHILQKLRMNH